MASVTIRDGDVDVAETTLVEGLPGAGLVGKIAVDHLAESLETVHYADVRCEGIPDVVVYRPEDSAIRPPVRILAAPAEDLVLLQSDVPVSPSASPGFADCVTDWLRAEEITPVYVSGLPVEESTESPELYGIATGDGKSLLDRAGIVPPRDGGMVSGPTGALLAAAEEQDLTGAGLVVETQARLPDPRAAQVVLEGGVTALTDVAVDTDPLVEHAQEIKAARERLAQQLQDAGDESSEAQPLRMFQ